MKKFAFMGSVAVAATMLAAPAAQAAGSPYFPDGAKSIQEGSGISTAKNHLQGSDGTNPVLWCDHGRVNWALAVRNTTNTTPLQVVEGRSDQQDPPFWYTQPVGKNWTIITGKVQPMDPDWTGGWAADIYITADPYTDDSSGVSIAVDGQTNSCKGLPTTPPALGQVPGAVATPPTTTTPKPTSTTTTSKPSTTSTAPKPTKSSTKPAPVVTPKPGTSSASATATVKITTPGGTKTTSTSTVVPVTKPVPAGGVTQTATVKVPSKGETAKATVTINPITPSAQPASPSTSATSGPKVDTDKVGSADNGLAMEMGLGAAALAAAGGALVVVRRRQS